MVSCFTKDDGYIEKVGICNDSPHNHAITLAFCFRACSVWSLIENDVDYLPRRPRYSRLDWPSGLSER